MKCSKSHVDAPVIGKGCLVDGSIYEVVGNK